MFALYYFFNLLSFKTNLLSKYVLKKVMKHYVPMLDNIETNEQHANNCNILNLFQVFSGVNGGLNLAFFSIKLFVPLL